MPGDGQDDDGDLRLLASALARLEATGRIEYTGEYGAELTTFVPFVGWLKQEGHLRGRRVVSYAGMRPYYCFLADAEFEAKPGPRRWVKAKRRDWPTNSTYTATRKRWHAVPDYRAAFAGQGPAFAREVLFIQNKFTVEWGRGPINFMPLDALSALFDLSDRFDIVYSRPRAMPGRADYAADDNSFCDYPDLALARSRQGVLVLEDHCEATGADYNLTKLQILARTHRFAAVQGGGAHLLAYFGRSVLLLLHRKGQELPHAYRAGAYRYLAAPPPLLLLARDYGAFDAGVPLLAAWRPEAGAMAFPAELGPVAEALQC